MESSKHLAMSSNSPGLEQVSRWAPCASFSCSVPFFNAFNMKWIYIATVVLFEVGSAVCGAAPNMNALIVGRVIAAAGGSGIYLGSLQ